MAKVITVALFADFHLFSDPWQVRCLRLLVFFTLLPRELYRVDRLRTR